MTMKPECFCDECVSMHQFLREEVGEDMAILKDRFPWEAYLIGVTPPRYPVPARIGHVEVYPECAVVYSADEDNFPDPMVTYWNESYGLPMPEDHKFNYFVTDDKLPRG